MVNRIVVTFKKWNNIRSFELGHRVIPENKLVNFLDKYSSKIEITFIYKLEVGKSEEFSYNPDIEPLDEDF